MNLSVEHINYSISKKELLKDISFQLDEGDILAVLGHNGAGKTSLFEILTDIVRPNSGTVFYDKDKSFSALKGKIGVLWDNISLFPLLKVKEVICYVLSMYHINSIPSNSFNYLELKPIENTLMSKLSKGEKRKVEIFLSTIHDPDMLILDEPTSFLDPLIRDIVWENIILQKNRTVLFSTHHWEEASKFASKIIFLYNGKILNNPASGKEIISSSKFVKKIIVHSATPMQEINAFSYEKKASVYYLIEKEHETVMNKIMSQTLNYSIFPIDLEDIYHYLIHKV